ncbi:double-strand break repair helicase AddA [Brevundimonas sp.]|uniref:double-strand break repair helicase AddA n=1 Tax=Brevundimonas sp. TaxID=1871086 RepID=UPI00261D2C0E|nr:double-strand break repair helicase AddA [Brevundimonas sp.]
MSGPPTSRPRPDPNQRTAADPGASVFVVANAGSGKTSTLVDRVARLLLKGTKPAEILCVTYTKAAAAEMQGRLFARLGEWAVMDDAQLADSLSELDATPADAFGPDDLSRARRLFARALETPGGLKIQTLHAFCEQLLRRFPMEAGIDPGFEVLDDVAAAELSHAAREDLARHALAHADDPVGRAYAHFAVTLDWQSFHDLLGRIEAERGVLTDWLERIAAGAAPAPRDLVGAPDGTLEAHQAGFVARLDRARWLETAEAMASGSKTDAACGLTMRTAPWTFAGLTPVFLTAKGEPRKSMATQQAPPAARIELERLQSAFLDVLAVSRSIRTAEETEHVLALARVHAAFYDVAKAATGGLDFADLIEGAVQLLTRRADAAWVLFKLDGGIDHVLLDEAQDTAPEQWDILRALTEGFFAGAGADRDRPGPRTVFAVGDEKQSIYSFQGARPERLREERGDYLALVENAGQTFMGVDLATSFRSTPDVLRFVDATFARPERAMAAVGETGDWSVHVAARADQAGCVDLLPLHEEDPPLAVEAWDAPLDASGRDGARKRLARDLAREIRRQVQTGVAVFDKGGSLRPCGYGDFLVLVRKRDALFEEILRGLKAAGVPVAGADRLKLSEHAAFHDLRALARFALFPDDDLTVAEILRGPFCDVDEGGLFDLAGAEATRPGLWAQLRARAGERPAWARARDLLGTALALADRDAFGFFAGLLNRVDADGLSGRVRMLNRLGAEAAEAIDETLNLVLAGEGRGAVDLETALSRMETAEVEVKRELEGARGQVRVMTVHGAKGLEAPVVILPDTTGVAAGGRGPLLLPVDLPDGSQGRVLCAASKGEDCPVSAAARAGREARTAAEGLRLLYVALTRARDRIVVMGRVAANRKPAAGSWYEAIAETFARLDGVRELDGGGLRFGADPVGVGPGAADASTAPPALPDWIHRPAPADRSARPASPSRPDGSIRPPAPSPLATAAGAGAPLGRFRRGDLIHRLLERLPDIAPDARPAAAVRLLAREPDLDDARRAEMIAAAMGVLDDARFADVFAPGSRAEVAVAARVGGLQVSGRIDRLALTPDRVLVVDFKTNRPAPDRIEDADPAYLTQMALYAAALSALYPDRRVEAALVWTDGPRLMPIPQALLDAALPPLSSRP